MDQPLPARLAAEALGTFLFFFMGFSGIAVVVETGAGAIGPLGVAAGFGFGLVLAITAFGHVSGGHYNPAVTAGLAACGRFPAREVVLYWRLRPRPGGCARHRAWCGNRRLGRADPRGGRHGAARHGHPDRHRRRGGALERDDGPTPDWARHLHGRHGRRPGVRGLVQPGSLVRPDRLQRRLGRALDLPRRSVRGRCHRRGGLDVRLHPTGHLDADGPNP
ncbi:MAG: hypothetical protein E6G20_12025 [Actinobacteria bacterium]|nr:MAG: hypothetical protein E6G20_12025 [Actinomycetota bacterium]